MSIQEAVTYFVQELSQKYDEQEAKNIVSVLMEDLFGVTNLNRRDALDVDIDIDVLIERLLAGEPIQYVTGIADFYGYKFQINKHALIPRPETEELVRQVLADHADNRRQLDVLDIGTGSGCIAITLQLERPGWRLFGLDYSLDALNLAKINARSKDAKVNFSYYNFLEKEDWSLLGYYDIIVSNPPYISEAEKSIMADNVLMYEPELALFAGEDPLVFYKAILEFRRDHLKPGGSIYLELNQYKSEEVLSLYRSAGLESEIIKDMQGADRILKAKCNA